MAYYLCPPRPKNWGTRPPVPHQIVPMLYYTKLEQYSSTTQAPKTRLFFNYHYQ